ncbi:hypothetical protein L227DRAFT_146707 [Lentinus tigrinus ALCF2SS1-6]|uniref:Uncharacterized protein n=1 Tax=Lentinus tigrinus ALCF2SS1-6 TaxID=1328759 RepID=A0A5C2STX1_9APHY|nr:hypothetical protein L227DRAFT_146707 [Lentinus tigrinus ALCF2SS1-6]
MIYPNMPALYSEALEATGGLSMMLFVLMVLFEAAEAPYSITHGVEKTSLPANRQAKCFNADAESLQVHPAPSPMSSRVRDKTYVQASNH